MAKDKVKKGTEEKVNTEPAEKVTAAAKKAKTKPEDTASKRTKQEKIALQNLLFGTSEKKLMVSDEFLNNMSAKYISKRMKTINSNYESIHSTKIPELFFKYCDEIESCLEELIVLEPYYSFKNPVPTVYKRSFLNHKPAALTAMLHRAWRNVLQKFPLGKPEDEIPEKSMNAYDDAINEMLKFQDRMSEDDLSLIDSFYKQVHGEEESELPEESTDGEEAQGSAESEESNSDEQ